MNNSGSEDLWLSATGAVVNGGRWLRGTETSLGPFLLPVFGIPLKRFAYWRCYQGSWASPGPSFRTRRNSLANGWRSSITAIALFANTILWRTPSFHSSMIASAQTSRRWRTRLNQAADRSNASRCPARHPRGIRFRLPARDGSSCSPQINFAKERRINASVPPRPSCPVDFAWSAPGHVLR